MPTPGSWPILHGDGRVEQLVLVHVNSPVSSSLTVTEATLGLISSDVDCFIAVGTPGINPRAPNSGGVGRRIYAGQYRDFLISPGYVFRVAGLVSSGNVFVEIQG